MPSQESPATTIENELSWSLIVTLGLNDCAPTNMCLQATGYRSTSKDLLDSNGSDGNGNQRELHKKGLEWGCKGREE